MNKAPQYYIGLMSGTSLDGADGVLVDFSGQRLSVVASASRGFDADFRSELLALNSQTHNELHRAALAGNHIALAYADVVVQLMAQVVNLGITAHHVHAIGAHGQTVRHQPKVATANANAAGATTDLGYTIQLNNPSLLAERTGIDVVADFRSRDVAAGGQGAPLVPAFHRRVFGQDSITASVLNIGGIANLSVLPADAAEPVLGFDCGPGNALMDAWCQRHTRQPFDAAGAWAATGSVVPALLQHLMREPYLSKPPPKSTGRDLFSLAWLAEKLSQFTAEQPQDIQATLTEFTANACADCVDSYSSSSKKLIVCGGGAFNTNLLTRLQARLPGLRVSTSDAHGLPPLQVEAAAFAWLARQTVLRQPGNLPSATGAAGLRILGGIYPA